jgi:hypothetical protein
MHSQFLWSADILVRLVLEWRAGANKNVRAPTFEAGHSALDTRPSQGDNISQ